MRRAVPQGNPGRLPGAPPARAAPSVAGWRNSNFNDGIAVDQTLAAAWRAAVATLEADPDTKLPNSGRASGVADQPAVSAKSSKKHRQRQDGTSPFSARSGAPI
jgi:hypothetical protein